MQPCSKYVSHSLTPPFPWTLDPAARNVPGRWVMLFDTIILAEPVEGSPALCPDVEGVKVIVDCILVVLLAAPYDNFEPCGSLRQVPLILTLCVAEQSSAFCLHRCDHLLRGELKAMVALSAMQLQPVKRCKNTSGIAFFR